MHCNAPTAADSSAPSSSVFPTISGRLCALFFEFILFGDSFCFPFCFLLSWRTLPSVSACIFRGQTSCDCLDCLRHFSLSSPARRSRKLVTDRLLRDFSNSERGTLCLQMDFCSELRLLLLARFFFLLSDAKRRTQCWS